MIQQLFNKIVSLLFPSLCLSCNKALYKGECYLCTTCWGVLPELPDDHLLIDPIEEKFWGKIPIRSAHALYYFEEQTGVQRMLHKIKYDYREKAARYLGRYYGQKLAKGDSLTHAERIVPIPLHPTRVAERGFNQSEAFAHGIAETIGITVDTTTLIRTKATTTQTSKTRKERFSNVQNAFATRSQEELKGQHIILVDDLITTGATIIGASQALLNIGVASISVIAIAVAF